MTRCMQPHFVTPIKSTGAEAAKSAGDTAFGASSNRGVFTLEGTAAVYFIEIPAEDALVAALHTQGDAAIAITTVTIEESCMPPGEVSIYSDNPGEWLAVDAARITSAAEGTGWTNTSDVIGNSAGNAGGGMQVIADCGARRMRARVVVATEGQARFAVWAKE